MRAADGAEAALLDHFPTIQFPKVTEIPFVELNP